MQRSFIKAQVVMDFVVEFNGLPKVVKNDCMHEVCSVGVNKSEIWQVFVNGAYNFKGTRLWVVIINHEGNCFEYSVRMEF